MVTNGRQRGEVDKLTVVMQGSLVVARVAAMIRAWINKLEADSSDLRVKPNVFQHSGCNSGCGSRRF